MVGQLLPVEGACCSSSSNSITHLQPLELLLELQVTASVVKVMVGVEDVVQTPAPEQKEYRKRRQP